MESLRVALALAFYGSERATRRLSIVHCSFFYHPIPEHEGDCDGLVDQHQPDKELHLIRHVLVPEMFEHAADYIDSFPYLAKPLHISAQHLGFELQLTDNRTIINCFVPYRI